MTADRMWWEEDAEEGQRHGALFEHFRALDWDQFDQRERMLQHASLYDPHATLLDRDGYFTDTGADTPIGPITTNVVKSTVDTATARVARIQTRPELVTTGAEWSTQRRAKKLSRWQQGEFYRTKFYRKSIPVFRDGAVLGLGALKVFEERKRVQCERTIPDELRVDEQECRSSPPRHLYQQKWMDVGILMAEFCNDEDEDKNEERKQKIKEVLSNTRSPSTRRARNRQIQVLEGWHLPSGPDEGDGRHLIAIDGADLVDEDYTKDYFPFCFYRWADRLTGFAGYPLTEEIVGLQLRINKLNRFIARCQDLMLVPRVYVSHQDYPHMKAGLKTEIGQVVPMRSGKPPTFSTPPAVSAEVYQDLEAQMRRAYELPGVSQAAASGMKPAGIDSGVGMREVKDIQTERFAIQEQQWEDYQIDACSLFIAIQKDIGDNEATTRLHRRGWMEEIKWADVDMERDVYDIQIRAASILSLSPGARKQTILEWAQWGIITSDEFKRLIDHPDLESELSLIAASIEDIDDTLERLLDGEWDPPEPAQNLVRGIPRVQQRYLTVRHRAPENVKQLLLDWMEHAKARLDEATAAMAPPPGAPPQPAVAPQTLGVASQ